MTGILDRVARSSSPALCAQFRPASPGEFFALRLAQKLGDAPAALHYAELLGRYSEGQLLVAYRRAKANGGHKDPARAFHTELGRLHGDTGSGNATHRKLAAIRVERRAIAVATLVGQNLQYPYLVRQLSSDSNKALGSAASFVSRILEQGAIGTAALEIVPKPAEAQRSLLAQSICQLATQQGIGIWEVPKQNVLSVFGYPPLRFRNQVREVISRIWPDVDGGFGTPLVQDALALGLYCQVEYLFNL